MMQIAIYGKGGIGKSTISANLSAALAGQDKKVLQIGCDPKYDSTRLLTGGHKITAVLDYIKETAPTDWSLNDILTSGYGGVSCVEAGGPKPGVGCAGRGILTTFELLEKLGIKSLNHDMVLYDVLGDVVCGGFAVPIRKEYADVIYIVTSGEFMSIYAANNILKGIKNYDASEKRVGGIIFNQRGISGEDERVKRFAEAVNLPISATLPRSDQFTEAEQLGVPLVSDERFTLGSTFKTLAIQIVENNDLYQANPLDDDYLEEVVLGRKFIDDSKTSVNSKTDIVELDLDSNKDDMYFSKNVLSREPLHGCAFSGAINILVQISDAVTIAHGPRSCAHIAYQAITSAGRRSLYERGSLIPSQIIPPLVSSDMNEGVMVFGGIEELKDKIKDVKANDPNGIFIVTSCPSGIIGDDVSVTKSLSTPSTPIIPVEVDGNINGDFLQGMINAYIETANSLIDKDINEKTDSINVIAEKSIARSTESNFHVMRELLQNLNIDINCRFISRTNVQDIKGFMKAKLNVLAYDDYMGRTMKQFLEKNFDIPFMEQPFPVGFDSTEAWLLKIGEFFQRQALVAPLIDENRKTYEILINRISPSLKGKRVMIVTYNHQLDWLIEPAIESGMIIEKVCVLNYSQENTFKSKFKDQFDIELNYDQNKRMDDIKRLKPDLVLSNYTSNALDGAVITDTIPLCPEAGFFSGINMAKRWSGLFRLNVKGGWKRDEVHFNKHHGR